MHSVEEQFSTLPPRLQLGTCRSLRDFQQIAQIGEGTYGRVYKTKDKQSGKIVALKQVKLEQEMCGIPSTSLREIMILKSLNHPNIVKMNDVIVGDRATDIFIEFEYCEHALSGILDQLYHPFTESEIKQLMLQLLSALDYIHSRWIIHRDLKLSNLLYTNDGNLKLADFGMARKFESRVRDYSPRVVTLWFRPPEILLGSRNYSTPVDIWGAGCIFGELLQRLPLFPGQSEFNQLDLIFQLLGTPNNTSWPGFASLPLAKTFVFKNYKHTLSERFRHLSPNGLDLLSQLLSLDPSQRMTAHDALHHPYFQENPLPTPLDQMPKYPSTNIPYRPTHKTENQTGLPPPSQRVLEAISKSTKQ